MAKRTPRAPVGPVTLDDAANTLEARSGEQLRLRRFDELRSALASVRREMVDRGVQPSPGTGPSAPGFVTSKHVEYQKLTTRIREAVRQLPADCTVMVVSKGDTELLKLDGRRAWHFPQNDDGVYAGHYPADSAQAIAHLESLRQRGADFVLFPQTAFWWLEYYGDFRKHLDQRYRAVVKLDDACVIYSLNDAHAQANPAGAQLEPTAPAATRDMSAAAPAIVTRQLPSETELRLRLAEHLAQLGRKEQACATLDEGLRLEPDNPRLLLQLASLQLSLGMIPSAEQHAQRLLRGAPNERAAHLLLARCAWQQQRLHLVEERLSHAAQLFPNDAEIWNDLINLLCARLEGKDSAATADAASVSRLMAHLAHRACLERLTSATRLRVVEVLQAAGQVELALSSLSHALENLDFAAETLQQFVLRLLRGIVADPSKLPLGDLRSLSAFLTHAGNGFVPTCEVFRSQACYRLALAADPKNRAAAFNLAFADMARGDVLAALEWLKSARRIYSDECARVVWPSDDGRMWPHADFNMAATFERLRPIESAWPRITVITPSFNQARYVEDTLQSVLRQRYPNLEYIVIDGGSTDGTVEILNRYRPMLEKLIVEADRGQSDALNKGLRLATGELILWINSDDMLAPGALFMIALTYLHEGADVIAGFCMEHSDRRFNIINLPAATQATFNVECLSDMFNYWLKGHYFYQPEVAFSRRILDRAGGSLDESLFYTMDYEFWLRCAAAGGQLAIVHWPIGLFRRHDAQKTANLDQCVLEQARVRDRFAKPQPGVERRLQIQRRLGRVFEPDIPRVSVVSTRAEKIFSADTASELRETFARQGMLVNFHGGLQDLEPQESDLVILLVHLHKEHEVLRKLRESGHSGPLTGWFWDNHHHVFDNYPAAADLDVCVAGHEFASHYLRSPRYLMDDPVPLCVTQWSAREAKRFFRQHTGAQRERQNKLYGGFVRYAFSEKRNRLIQRLIENGMSGVYFLEEDALGAYFGLSLEERFEQWSSYKTSICLPLAGDLSQRLFDSLLTGQIPIVPRDVYDLDQVMSPAEQRALPIIRFDAYSVEAVKEAHAAALHHFDEEGSDGVLRRHRFALRKHMFVSRIAQLIDRARHLAGGFVASNVANGHRRASNGGH